ncbi:hypothetical protein NM208_g8507 [Fusarium decemcellulare]|uniref:Uncharacterized protein n=1 Tax=Fusarium decemcellulare TaxID=57161 RepID=A0ACC1S591_9HYPO|nr:hypothetical protein NM208_g8507 [Fusarium decemcellulare]
MKPSPFVFDPDWDTQLILATCRPQPFNWEDETLWIGQKKPTKNAKRKRDSTTPEEQAETATELHQGQQPSQSPIETATVFNASMDVDNDPVETSVGVTLPTLPPAPENADAKEIDTWWRDGERPGALPGQVEIRMVVSGKHMALASPYFQKMFAGPYVEGKADDRGLRQVRASDWDPEAFTLLLDIIHGYHRDVPKAVSLELLAKLAIIVDYYQCHESIDVYVDIWLGHLKKNPPTAYGQDCMLWILISQVLSRADMFESMTGLALEYSTKLIEAKDLPLPAGLLSIINKERQVIIAPVFTEIYGNLDALMGGSVCFYECSCMLLGSLTKVLSKRGILNPRITRPYNGFSVADVKRMVDRIRSPKWVTLTPARDRYVYHGCNVKAKLAPILKKMNDDLCVFQKGFEFMKDYRGNDDPDICL